MSVWLPLDPEPGSTEQEAEAPSSVKDRRLNAQVQGEEKGDFGGRLFPQVLCSSSSFILTVVQCAVV